MQNKMKERERDFDREQRKRESRAWIDRARLLGCKTYEERKEVEKILKGGLK